MTKCRKPHLPIGVVTSYSFDRFMGTCTCGYNTPALYSQNIVQDIIDYHLKVCKIDA
jgi:hypothetical protein